MIIGSGLIARAFSPHAHALRDCCIYAAGISNSSCIDSNEFHRDRERLRKVVSSISSSMLFIYFSTCSIDDPYLKNSQYVKNKFEMEKNIRKLDRHLVIRLPQVAGSVRNPHTLLNYLYERIGRSERFELWRFASRNVIDIDDVVRIVLELVLREGALNETINVANVRCSMMPEIVAAIEKVTGRRALCDLVDRGAIYSIDTSRIIASLDRCGIVFDENYLIRTIAKYYRREVRWSITSEDFRGFQLIQGSL